jgi:hypothetical protein
MLASLVWCAAVFFDHLSRTSLPGAALMSMPGMHAVMNAGVHACSG